MSNSLVRFSHVSKRFRLGETHDSLRDLFSYGLNRLVGRHNGCARASTFWAVDDVDFEVTGDKPLGIIGPNGAGKSTVLKLLAGILRADKGSVEVRGRLAALIEIGAGFHGDLTGRENIFLNGAILGMSRAEIRSKLDAIVAFAGLERFLDMPVKRYSSGMYARLGFSIAAHVDPDILLVDEVLSVGDAVFRLRCAQRMRELVEGGTTLIFVTHNLDQMQSICPRAIVLSEGRCVFDGTSREAVGHYFSAMSRAYVSRPGDVQAGDVGENDAVELLGLRILNEAGEEVVWARAVEPLRAESRFRLHRPIERLVVELNMRSSSSENLLSVNSGRDGVTLNGTIGEHTVTLAMDDIPVCSGQYFWNVRIWDADRGTAELDTPFRFPLVIDDEGRATGIFCVDHEWSFGVSEAASPSYATSSKVLSCADLPSR
ncbi:MAG: ABC transporter ATP-binding protein [Phycisphaerales bacterium]|nr:MAG: ABC transporter ATP-binding protein [Phycisphaerales bacterium]